VNPDGTGDYPTIKAAIDAAVEGDTIQLGEGTFVGSGNHNLDFGGKNLILTSVGGSSSTIVDLERDFFGSNRVDRFLTLQNGETSASIVEGVTIRNCLFQEDGGAFLLNGASPVIRDVLFDAIESRPTYSRFPIQEIRGGAILVRAGSPTISDCVFQDFYMPNGRGGAIYANGAGPIVVERCTFRRDAVLTYVVSLTNGLVVDCLFEGNTGSFPWGHNATGSHSLEDSGSKGGAESRGFNYISQSPLRASGGPVEVRSCTFTDNYSQDGGAINANGLVIVEDCIFQLNGGETGGAAWVGSGVVFRRCSFLKNSAYFVGAVRWGGSGEMIDCVIRENLASITRGAIWVGHSAAVSLSGCTIIGNNQYGVGIGTGGGTFQIVNTIIAFGTGPAVECNGDPSAITLTCCDLYGNSGGDWTSCIPGQLGQNGNISADPLFCDVAADNLTLSSNSPCAPDNSNGCGLIGTYGIGCDARINVGADQRMEATSWGRIKGMYR